MNLSSNNNHADWRIERSNYSPAEPEEFESCKFLPAETERHHRILQFFEIRPNSSLLAIVQHLVPNFLTLATDERARVWFAVKMQRLAMETLGVLQSEKRETDVQSGP